MVTAARLAGRRMAKDYLELAANCESEAAKAQDRFSRYQLLSFAENYRMLAESAAALDRSAKALKPLTTTERHTANELAKARPSRD
jgi:hypothetical protein